MARILAFAGSAGTGSLNRRLLAIPVAGAREAGAETTVVELRDFPLPVYDSDLESSSGLPENARRLKALFLSHDALLIASPEYNSSVTGLLKNTLDWVSRPAPGEASLACFDGKVAALCSASPGSLGGLRGLAHLRQILGNIRVLVIPDQVAVPDAGNAFDDSGALRDPKRKAALERLGATLARIAEKLRR